MGSRYLFIILYVFFEHHLSRGDYRRIEPAVDPARVPVADGPDAGLVLVRGKPTPFEALQQRSRSLT